MVVIHYAQNPSWKTGREFKTQTDENTIDPKAPLKDTLIIPAGGYAVVYFKADNPGWWFLHCHIEVHQLEGMGVIIDEGEESNGDKTVTPKEMSECGNFSYTAEKFKTQITELRRNSNDDSNNNNNGNNNNNNNDNTPKDYYAATIGLGTTAAVLLVALIVAFLL